MDKDEILRVVVPVTMMVAVLVLNGFLVSGVNNRDTETLGNKISALTGRVTRLERAVNSDASLQATPCVCYCTENLPTVDAIP